jgi:predicted nucleic acid-binding protein
MIVCIDTNTLIQGRVPRHRYFPILDAIVAGRLHWAVSNRVLAEYEEIVTASAGVAAWTKLEHLMELIDVTTGNLISSPRIRRRLSGSKAGSVFRSTRNTG